MNKKLMGFLIVFCILIFCSTSILADSSINSAYLISEVRPLGQKITAVAVEYPDVIDNSNLGSDMFDINVRLIDKSGREYNGGRTITRVYTNNEACRTAEAVEGQYVIVELNENDDYALTFYYNERAGYNYNFDIEYSIVQKSELKYMKGGIIQPGEYSTNERKNLIVDKFKNMIYFKSGTRMAYSLYIPDNYDPDRSYPLVLYMHGAGERGFDNQVQIRSNRGAVVWAEDDVQQKNPAFVLAPQVPYNQSWRTSDNKPSIYAELIIDLLSDLEKNYNIDTKRIYSTGLSMGGFGVFLLAEAHPDVFAAVVPICGGGNTQLAYRLADKPIWIFHAEDDPTVPVYYSRIMVAALMENKNLKYTEYVTGVVAPPLAPMAHFSWVPAYDNMEMVDWVLSQRLK